MSAEGSLEMPEEESQKKELLGLLSEAPAKASLAEELAQDLQKSAHLVGELAPAVRQYVEQVPATSLTPEEWSHQIKGWRSFNEFAGKVTSGLPRPHRCRTPKQRSNAFFIALRYSKKHAPRCADSDSIREASANGQRWTFSKRACFSRDRANPCARHFTGKHLGGDQPVEQAKN